MFQNLENKVQIFINRPRFFSTRPFTWKLISPEQDFLFMNSVRVVLKA